MAFNVITLPVVFLFIVNGFGQLYYAIKLKKKYPEEHNIINSYISFVLWIIAGLLYPFIYLTDNSRIRWFQALSTFFICIFTPGILFLILYYQYRVVKKNPEIKKRRSFSFFRKEFNQKTNEGQDVKISKFKKDLYRKALHLFPASVIIILWIFAVYIWDGIWNADLIWGISGENFGKFLIITAGYSGILAFAVLDYVRLSHIFKNHNIFHLLPDNVSTLLGKALNRNELYEFTRPAVFVLALVPIFFFPFGIFAAAALIATIGDGAASLFGIKFGKRNFPKGSDKTVVGYIAGFLVSFGIVILSLWIFESDLVIEKVLIIALGGAVMFFIIDYLSLKIDDDILNPLFCAIVMVLLYYFL
jgi:dolichol kinase